ncbi:hypothetical protein [Nonomuraea sp. LPB2021202275-12-8]|uniref:hypothetical protein n=1 Tax=Nonomuraea sp. LPB2021202275-12-8 TaxID=3120159 RepID=UPI00300D6B26
MAAPPIPEDVRDMDTADLQDLVRRHRMCMGKNGDRWAAERMTDRQARRLCVGCPINGIGGACFELAVRDDMARVQQSRREPVNERSQLRLHVVYGGQTPGVRARVVLARLLASAA